MHRALTTDVLVVVLAAGVLHACWNAITKSVEDRLVVFAWIEMAATTIGVVGLCVIGLPSDRAIPFAVVSGAIHVVYDLALINSYRLGSFNQMYPLARGTAPLLVAVGAAVFANERLGALALAGVLVLAVGLMSLALSSGRLGFSELPAVAAAVATGVTIAAYTLVDGLGARRSGDAFAYMMLLFVVQGPAFIVAAAIRRPRATWTVDGLPLRGLGAGVLTVIAYGAVIWAQVRAPLADVSALRETGVISGAIIGALVFKERFGLRRVAAATIVALGIALIAL